MNVSVENLGACKRLLRIEVPVERVNAVFDEVTGQFQKAAQLPGFRPGKAPRHLILRSFESRIVEEARKKLIEESYREAARQQNLHVVVTLNVEEQQFGRGLPLQFTVNLEAAPDFELPNYKGLAARRELAVATDGDVDRALGILREQQAKYNDVAREAAAGDVVVVHYQGTCEGRPITDLSPAAQGLGAKQNTWLLIAENSFVPGFTPQLVGARAGDHRQIIVTFPADFVVREVAGKEASYAVEVLGVKEKLLPEVNEDFSRLFGLASVDDLLRGIRNDLQRELDTRQKRSVRDQLLKALLAQREFELPESVVASETRSLVFNIVNENQQRG
ncbi:MAG: trigger factor, partial [Verrucomicrobiota bacterium]